MKPTRETNPVETETLNIADERKEQLQQLFPDIFTEGRVECSKLRNAVGELADDTTERYTFSWAGKRKAIQLLQTPTRATLIPVRNESINFDETQNLFIEGDNLEVLKLLYKPYFGRVKMIYIDPPYNTGNDFIYSDNYADPLATYLQLTGQQDAGGNLLRSNTESSGRFHSAWLSMMYPRLFLARQLLEDGGVIFVSIDDTEVANLRLLMNEVFGEENFVASIVWQKKYSPQNDAKWLSDMHDHILLYARDKQLWRPTPLARTEEQDEAYKNPDRDPRGPWKATDSTCNKSRAQRPNLYYPIINPHTAETIYPLETRVWRYSRHIHDEKAQDNRVWWGPDGKNRVPAYKSFLSEVKQGRVPTTLWSYQEAGHNQLARQELNDLIAENTFDTPKPAKLIKRMAEIATVGENDIVLDFFAGSGTTAQAVLDLNREDGGNRRFILVQLPEPTGKNDFRTIADIGKERIRRVIARMKGDGKEQPPLVQVHGTEDLGFKVLKLAPSHFKPWVGVKNLTSEQYTDQMALYNDPLVDGWTPEGVIQEVALKEGYGLGCKVEKISEEVGQTVYRVIDPDREQSFAICLDGQISLAGLKPLHLAKDNLFVCRDSALDDEAAANLALQCRLKTI